MDRAKKIIQRILDTVNEEDFNELVIKYKSLEYARVIERQLVFDDTFLNIFKIFTKEYNDEYEYYLRDMTVIQKLNKDESENQAKIFAAIHYGSIDIVGRVNSFLFLLNSRCIDSLNPYAELRSILDENLIETKFNIIQYVKYLLRQTNTKMDITIPSFKLFMISITSGKTLTEVKDKIVQNYNDGEMKL